MKLEDSNDISRALQGIVARIEVDLEYIPEHKTYEIEDIKRDLLKLLSDIK